MVREKTSELRPVRYRAGSHHIQRESVPGKRHKECEAGAPSVCVRGGEEIL